MINEIVNSALAPFMEQVGWQGFAYGVTGRIIIIYAKNIISEYNSSAAEAADETEDYIDQSRNE